jgi:hypothetical protein
MEFDISYTSKEITPWGGMVFMKQMLQNIGFRELVENNPNLPVSGSNRGYKSSTIIEGFITSIWCGLIGFCIPKSRDMMRHWERYLTGRIPLVKIPINDFSPNLLKRPTKK